MQPDEIIKLVDSYFTKYHTIDMDVYQSCIERLFMYIQKTPSATAKELLTEIRREVVRMEVAKYRRGMRFNSIIDTEDDSYGYSSYSISIGISSTYVSQLVDNNNESDTYTALMGLHFDGRIGDIFELLKLGYTKKESALELKVSESLIGYYIINKLAPAIIKSKAIELDEAFRSNNNTTRGVNK